LFLYGVSFGGLLAFNMSIKFPTLFSGVLLNSPFFKHYTDILDKYKYMWKFCDLFKFYFSINNRNPSSESYKKIAAQYPYFHQDEKAYTYAKISSLVLFLDEQQFARENYNKCKTPIMLALAKEDVAI